MAEFASPVDAVEAAISIQKEVADSISNISDDIRIEFRVGVNLGDIMIQDNNLYGDNVNIAARLESISEPGEICVSEKVYLEINNKVNTKFHYLGEKKLKNISQKIKVYISDIAEVRADKGKNRYNKKIISLVVAGFFILISAFYFSYKKFFKDDIQYTDNSKSVLENFRMSQSSINDAATLVDDGKLVISLMSFQNQTTSLTASDIDVLNNLVSKALTDSDEIRVTASPEGSENLNPPEVMLIATESNASFVINGIVYSEAGKNLISLKVYEAKRGSIIINEKLVLSNDNQYSELFKFFSAFKKDVLG